MDTLGTNNMMTQETERSSRRRVRIRDKDNLPDSTVPGLPGNADILILFIQVMDLFDRQFSKFFERDFLEMETHDRV